MHTAANVRAHAPRRTQGTIWHAQELSGENAWECAGCKRAVTASKCIELWRAPECVWAVRAVGGTLGTGGETRC